MLSAPESLTVGLQRARPSASFCQSLKVLSKSKPGLRVALAIDCELFWPRIRGSASGLADAAFTTIWFGFERFAVTADGMPMVTQPFSTVSWPLELLMSVLPRTTSEVGLPSAGSTL